MITQVRGTIGRKCNLTTNDSQTVNSKVLGASVAPEHGLITTAKQGKYASVNVPSTSIPDEGSEGEQVHIQTSEGDTEQ
jgi:hypothetical protein